MDTQLSLELSACRRAIGRLEQQLEHPNTVGLDVHEALSRIFDNTRRYRSCVNRMARGDETLALGEVGLAYDRLIEAVTEFSMDAIHGRLDIAAIRSYLTDWLIALDRLFIGECRRLAYSSVELREQLTHALSHGWRLCSVCKGDCRLRADTTH